MIYNTKNCLNMMHDEAVVAVNAIKEKFSDTIMPTTAIILGSGLGYFTQEFKILNTIVYADIPHFPQTHVVGHKGCLSIVELQNQEIALVMEGRFHYYEGYSASQVTFPILIFHLLGIKNLIITNAAGGINANFTVGDFMLINDHINLTGNHPLIGKNNDILGPRFLDQTAPYNSEFITIAKNIAVNENLILQEGVYLSVSGPTYETKAEINAFRTLGADAVGMSTVYEVIAANYFKIKVLAISNITNMATGLSNTHHEHQNIVNNANKNSTKFIKLVHDLIIQINNL